MADTPPEDQAKNELDFVRQWLDAIQLSEDEEKDWAKKAERACEAYRGGHQDSESNINTFNIFHSNVETLVPSLYNSTPIPDVRRRFNDDDDIGREVSEIFERSLSVQVDAYDFDNTVFSAVRDMAITSRGIVRVRYEPQVERDEDGNPVRKSYEQTGCEYVLWRSFRRGPAKTWPEVPWIAIEQYLSYSEVEKLVADEKDKGAILKGMRFSYTAEPKKSAEQQADNASSLAKRARVWEIWDKDNRQVHFISPDYTARRLTTIEDPLELTDFYPIPRPLAAIIAPDSLVPITLLQIYEELINELNVVQRRIMKLTGQLRARGWYTALNADDIKLASEADDGEMIPITGAETFVTQGSGLDKAISYWPIDTIAKALEQLVAQREQIKATIYEVTGLSDIIRGASDARETATAQQIKSQWGSLRIQRMQQEVARFARDLFRLKCEIMARKFSFETFEMMTGIKFPTEQQKQEMQQQAALMQQAQQPIPPELQETLEKPAREQVEQLIRDDFRNFRIDIESDSTIRGDVQRNQEQAALFIQGIGEYTKSVAPLVQEGAMPPDVAIEILAAFCRTFRLGKQAEDSIDRWADQAKQAANQPKPPPPEEIKAQAELKKIEMQTQADREKHEMEKEKMKLQLVIEREKLNLKREEMDMRREEMNLDVQAARQKAALEQEQMAQQQQFQETEHAMDLQASQRQHALNQQAMSDKAQFQRQSLEDKAKFQKQQMKKPKAA
jgi:hypothetical protein